MQSLEKFSTDIIQMTGNKIGPISPVVAQSAAFGYSSCQEAEDIFKGEVKKPLYSRMGNPTSAKLESILAHMDGGVGAVATSSGMGAISMACLSILESGDEVICIGGLFGGTYALFTETTPRFGVKSHFFDVDELDKIEDAINDNTKIIFLETVGNPSMSLPDIPKILDLANKYDVISMVDNTVTPITIKPLELGADIVVYSTTKIIAGNASALGGAVVFREAKEDDTKLLSPRYPFYKNFIKNVGKMAMLAVSKKRGLRDLGMSASANSSYLTMLGFETLPFRLPRLNTNVKKVALALEEAGLNVNHPALDKHPHHELYTKLFQEATGSLLTIDFGTKEKAYSFLDNSKLITKTANIGDSRTLGLHMDSTIYRDFNAEQKGFLGITDGLVRISIGLENADDIISDFIAASKI